jgi:hypothetical protein
LETFADKFESEQELHEWLISFYEEQLYKFFSNVGGITEHGVKITPRLIKMTMKRYSQLMEKYNVADWEQS